MYQIFQTVFYNYDSSDLIWFENLQVSSKVISIRCVTHWLTLAVGQAARYVTAVNYALHTLDKFNCYYQKSHIHSSGFRKTQVQ